MPPGDDPVQPSASPLLRIEGLGKSYASPQGGSQAVVDVPEFALEGQGQMALHGPSGCGKTTFLHLIAGILLPDRGTVRIRDRDVASLAEPERDRFRAAHIGYIYQSFNLLQGFTCLENVLLGMAFGPGPSRARARELLERVDLGGRLHHLPRQLSVGQQQRVAVARALASRPSLVLADEPTGNLDPGSARKALALIREACEENRAALLWVSHDEGLLREFGTRRDFSEINRAVEACP